MSSYARSALCLSLKVWKRITFAVAGTFGLVDCSCHGGSFLLCALPRPTIGTHLSTARKCHVPTFAIFQSNTLLEQVTSRYQSDDSSQRESRRVRGGMTSQVSRAMPITFPTNTAGTIGASGHSTLRT
jgi:hypothetical protein